MKKFTIKFIVPLFSFALLIVLLTPLYSHAQKRDYMTDAESELVREAQEIDLRVSVLTKMIDRRFALINNEPVKTEKDSEKWGAPPIGTRLELLSDINKLLQKAVDDIDDVAAHNRMDGILFPKAMRNLAEAAQRYLPKLKSIYDQTPDEREKGLLIGASDFCDSIIEAAAKLPKETPKEEKKRKSKTGAK